MRLYNNVFMPFDEMIISNGKTLLETQLKGLDSAICKIDGVDVKVLFQISSNEYNDRYEQRIVISDLNTTLKRGSIISNVKRKGFDIEDEGNWIVITEIDINQISKYCKVQKCTNTLTFQLSDNSIYSTPCIYDSPAISATDKTSDNNYFAVNNGIVKITVQSNEFTKTLKNDHRLIFDSSELSCFSITHTDVSSKRGMIIYTIKECLYNETNDRLDLNIADYNSFTPIPTPINELFIDGVDIIYFNFSSSYEAKLYLAGELIIPQPVTIIYSVDKTNLVTLTQIENIITIKANQPIGDYSDQTIVLTASDGTNTAVKNINLKSL